MSSSIQKAQRWVNPAEVTTPRTPLTVRYHRRSRRYQAVSATDPRQVLCFCYTTLQVSLRPQGSRDAVPLLLPNREHWHTLLSARQYVFTYHLLKPHERSQVSPR